MRRVSAAQGTHGNVRRANNPCPAEVHVIVDPGDRRPVGEDVAVDRGPRGVQTDERRQTGGVRAMLVRPGKLPTVVRPFASNGKASTRSTQSAAP